MKLTYTGKQERLTPAQERKVQARLNRLSKILDRRGEKEGHVVLTTQRHLQKAEVTFRFYDHPLVAAGASSQQFDALLEALDKVEQQAVRLRSKWRDTKRAPESSPRVAGTPGAAAAPAARPAKAKPAKTAKPVRSKVSPSGKPMTAEEAMMAFDEKTDYLVFKDADSNRTSVLVRRRDGRVDLIEP
jgi:putative sigma-54 modulation protein